MFARKVSIQLQPNKFAEFTKTLEGDVIPLLRKQPGFKDEITLGAPDDVQVLAISLWDTEKNAASYSGGAYKDVLKTLESLTVGTPKVETSEVINSTLHQIRAGVMAA
jgi:heme-degrading monooxygenase HmoA